MEFGAPRKRGRHEVGGARNGFGGKKSKQETESLSTGIGSKSKPCTKFFSTSGCQFGETCHFLHHIPGGIKAVTQMLGNNPAIPTPTRNASVRPSFPDGASPPARKTRICSKYNTAEGCKYGDKCHFAHGEWELGKPTLPLHEESVPPQVRGGRANNRFGGRMDPTPTNSGPTGSSFGASATAKISVDASLVGAIIGKGGVNSKQICRLTGVKLAIRDHDSDSNLKNIELEGTLDQIKQASQMVHEITMNVNSSATGQQQQQQPLKNHTHNHHHHNNRPVKSGQAPGNNLKTKICENFTKGKCTFGDRCHFAHGADELRKSAI